MDIEDLFFSAASENWLDLLIRYQLEGGNINCHALDTGWTLLHLAAEMQNLNAIEWLISHGADIDAKDHSSRTPLHQAVDIDIDGAIQRGRDITLETAALLIRLGADEAITDSRGETPRDIARAYQQVDKYDAIER